MIQTSSLRRTWRGIGLAALLASLSVAAQPPTAPFPTVDSVTQRVRDKDRQRILLAELAAEQQALAEAQQRLAALRTSPQPGDQFTATQASVVTHRHNIDAISSELARTTVYACHPRCTVVGCLCPQSSPAPIAIIGHF